MESKIGQSIQYGQLLLKNSEYRYTKVIQNTGGDTLELKNASQSSTFEIPVVGFNLAKSSINFTQVVPLNTTLTHKARAFRHTPPWSRIELYTRGGTYLMDITNFAHVYTAFGQRTKTIKDFEGNENGIVRKVDIGDFDILEYVEGVESKDDGKSPPGPVPGIGDVTVKWKIPGRELYNTIMSLDKTLIVGEVLNLKITWNPAQHHGYWVDNTGANPVDIATTSAVKISDLALYLAQEVNPTVQRDLMDVINNRGLSVLIPYIHSYKTSLGDGLGSHAISIRLSRGYGQSLERVYTLFGTGAEEKNTRYDAVLADTTTSSFYSLLNSKRMQEFDVSVANGDYDWMKVGEKKGRVVSLQPSNDSGLFAHSENWCGDHLECAVRQENGGLSLEMEQKYDLYVNRSAGGPIHYYTAAVCQKQLVLGPGGIMVS